ncbi:MAG: hypothetical protein QOI38_1666 [Sphingomonadales bacterium]|jgi:hypothetical protein|nr:hypothetical protein [Sphingomonadales bacterium]
MTGAGEAVRAAAVAALQAIGGIGRVCDAPPLTGAAPHALVEIDSEADWGHKSGAGRELRLAAKLTGEGERPLAMRARAAAAEAALAALGPDLEGWRLVTMRHVRTRELRRPKGGWIAVIEFRARLLAEA